MIKVMSMSYELTLGSRRDAEFAKHTRYACVVPSGAEPGAVQFASEAMRTSVLSAALRENKSSA